jgi:RHS repeat-associated protein
VGNRITKTETRDILHNRRWREKEERTTYIYDQIHRLTGTEHTRIMGNDREKAKRYRVEEHTYDPAGNRLTGPKHRTGYTYNQGNQLLTVKRRQYKYDNNGNLIKKVEIDKNGKEDKTTLYTYDYDNKLIKVIKQESGKYITVTFAYDPFGRRILKTLLKEKEGEVTTRTTSYIYDNEDIIFEENKNGEITRYTHGPGIDEPISIEQKGKAYYYHFDGLGSVTALTDSDGEVAKEYTYDPFGRLKMKGEKLKQPYTYTGREWDSETGLYYYRARYYDPKIGRFITKDPFPGILLNPQTLNPYPYVGNNPVNHLDPLGLWYIDIGFSGSTTGTLGPGVAGGIQIGPAGIFIYGGFGVGFGAGASATINTSDPSVGVSVIATGRGGYLAGSQISYSYGQEGGL